jgi:hypothetical protein
MMYLIVLVYSLTGNVAEAVDGHEALQLAVRKDIENTDDQWPPWRPPPHIRKVNA